MKFGVRVAAAAACVALSGCSTWQTAIAPTPTSYGSSREQIPRTVGKLRRLAVLATDEKAPAACGASDGELAVADAGAASDYLHRHKGYAIVALDVAAYAEWLDAARNGGFLRELADWLRDTSGEVRPGPLVSALVRTAASRERTDGVLFVHRRHTCQRANTVFRGLLGIGTLGMSELMPDPKLQELHPIYHVAIVESAGLRPVWRRSVSVAWHDFADQFSRKEARPVVETLFEDLEPAVPAILTR